MNRRIVAMVWDAGLGGGSHNVQITEVWSTTEIQIYHPRYPKWKCTSTQDTKVMLMKDLHPILSSLCSFRYGKL